MRRQGPLTLRHLAVAAIVVIIVNAQLTWWVVYVMRENSNRLRLERQEILDVSRHERDRIATELVFTQTALLAALADSGKPRDSSPPEPFSSWSLTPQPVPGWHDHLDGLELIVDANGLIGAQIDQAWRSQLLTVTDPLEITDRIEGAEVNPHIVLPAPFEGLVIKPTDEAWSEILEGYRGRIKMMVAEGTFFAILLFIMLGLLWKTFRREVELERQHRNFLSAITHELKSPLAAMRLSLETVLRGRADSTTSVRFLENALQDTERLQSLVQKVLEVTRYGQSGGHLELRRACLHEVIEDNLATFSRRATSAGASVIQEIEPDIAVNLDHEAFDIVLSNLLENAIKYGGTIPKIGVKVALLNGSAHVDVTDNGNGINEEEVPFIFNRFFRGGDEMTRTTQGTGLGLYLVRQIMRAHRGTVEVHTTGAKGTTFRLTLPDAEVWEDTL